MNKLYLLLILSFSFTITTAQNDPNAKKILTAVSAEVKKNKTITANFSITSTTSKGRANGVKTGTISIKGQQYVIKQGKTEVISDGNKTYNYDGSKTVTVSAADEAGQTLTPQKILSGSYDKDFSYKLLATKGNFHEIEMKPLDPMKNFSRVNVFVDKAKSMIVKAVILDKGSNKVEVAFSNMVFNKTLADNLFVFNIKKYPKDTEVLD